MYLHDNALRVAFVYFVLLSALYMRNDELQYVNKTSAESIVRCKINHILGK